jgi:hypothetical protein
MGGLLGLKVVIGLGSPIAIVLFNLAFPVAKFGVLIFANCACKKVIIYYSKTIF